MLFEDSADFLARIDQAYGEGMGALVLEEFAKDEIAERKASRDRQIAAANRNHSRANLSVEGLGQRVASIDGASWAYWQNREPGCWQDKQFLNEYLRDNPEARVPHTPAAAKIIVPETKYSKVS